MRRGPVKSRSFRWKVVSLILATVYCGLFGVFAADKGLTIVVKKDERRIAGIGTNGISHWTSSVARDDEVVTAVNQSGNTAMVSVTNKKTGKTRILNTMPRRGFSGFLSR
jgi:hypothetical protein